MRTKLKAARIERGLSQVELANEINYSPLAVGQWELGKTDPGPDAIKRLCVFFGKNPVDLDLAKDLTESELRMIEKILENKTMDRRQLWELLALPAFAGIDLSALSKPLIPPDQFLSSCNATINACWQLMKGDEFSVVGEMLAANMPTLTTLATQSSEFQEDAALLAMRAKIMQILLATYNEDYVGRNLLCREAVQYAELSGNHLALTAALYWQADTYVYCYHQPSKATPLLEKGLACIDSNSLQNKSAFCADLAIAYAQDGNETLAQRSIEQAGNALILGPRGMFDCNLSFSGLYRDEGKMFLALAQRFPEKKNYARDAYEAFSKSLEYGPLKETSYSQAFTHKADAARLMGDLGEFAGCLLKGVNIAIKIKSKKHRNDARLIMNKAPSWKNEQVYQIIAQMF